MMGSTVAAISTPHGRGGVALIRISGPEAVEVAEGMFRPASGRALAAYPARTAVYGEILLRGQRIDSGIATVFRAPASFTGEDTVEIACHGGVLLTETVLQSAFLCGAEQAGAGEFTKRAFLNGKIGLSEAEGIIDLIEAESDEQLRMAVAQSGGRLRREIDALSGRLRRLLASVYALIDYPDEDLSEVSEEEMAGEIEALLASLDRLKDSYRSSRVIKEGIRTAIVGRPNTGKSSLLNLLLGRERAIVTDIPGTTRDTVEESAVLGRAMLRLCDTAGIRTTDDAVEQIGVTRSVEALEGSELVIAVFDGSAPFDDEDGAMLDRLRAYQGDKQVLVLLNKSDRGCVMEQAPFAPFPLLIGSVKEEGEALRKRLSDEIEARFLDGRLTAGQDAMITNARQLASLSAAADALARGGEALSSGLPRDLVGLDLEQALSCLLETDGRGTSDQIVNEIFSRFCVGK